jgi:uncharacterized membrane protein (DUF485 family)
MDISTLNWLAIILATLAFYATGAIWYSPILFGNIWMKEVNLTQDGLKNVNMAKIFTLTFILSFIMVLNLAFFLNSPDVDAKMGAIYGFMTGFGWVAMAMILTALYEQRTWRYMAIHAGYMIVGFTLAGVILGAWK